jgi:hypothetical protein
MVTERTFDHITLHDERSRNYAIADVLETAPITSRFWTPGAVLDQGREGACVGFGISGDLSASPVRIKKVTNQFASTIYHEAQAIDGIDDSQEGTSVNAGMKIAVKHGFYAGYRWAFSIEDVRQSLLQVGPVVSGINWYDGMYDAPGGKVTVSGELVGGHCILLCGYSRPRDAYRWRNSWGSDYGVNGNAYIKAEDLYRLLITEKGEAAVPIGRKLVKT